MAGTLAGAESGSSAGDDDADGSAFQGKLAVFDFGDSDNSNALTTPDEVGDRKPVSVLGGCEAGPVCLTCRAKHGLSAGAGSERREGFGVRRRE